MSNGYPEFNSTKNCKKCGANTTRKNSYLGARITYCPEGTILAFNELMKTYSFGNSDEPGVIIRECNNCSYKWIEKTLDQSNK